jgi:uncharacterized Zn finger protein (UPF0148 family)
MKETIREEDIDKLSVEKQLEFYKQSFHSQHCGRCSNELAWGWVEYDGDLYCDDCFNYVVEEEKGKVQKEINEYENRIKRLKEDYDL